MDSFCLVRKAHVVPVPTPVPCPRAQKGPGPRGGWAPALVPQELRLIWTYSCGSGTRGRGTVAMLSVFRARPQGFLSSRSGVGAQESRFETNSPRDADTSDLEATLWTPLTSGNQLSVLLALTVFDQVLKLLTLWGRGDTTRLLCGHVLCEREREGERERGGGPFISHSATGLFPT